MRLIERAKQKIWRIDFNEFLTFVGDLKVRKKEQLWEVCLNEKVLLETEKGTEFCFFFSQEINNNNKMWSYKEFISKVKSCVLNAPLTTNMVKVFFIFPF